MNNKNNSPRRTKIIATLGPSSSVSTGLEQLLNAHIDLIRLNFSHGTHDEHRQNIEFVRNWSKTNNREIGIMADLQGPKIRIGQFENNKVTLVKDQTFTLDVSYTLKGNEDMVGVSYQNLPNDLKSGDILLLDDGLIKMTVSNITGSKIQTIVNNDGTLSNNKGLNKLGGGLTCDTFTTKDQKDLEFALSMDCDFIALSFVKNESDIINIKKIILSRGSKAKVLAKIERIEAIKLLDEIIEASDGVMVARGDLGIEAGIEEVPALQKLIIARSRALNKAVITATQMMESMIEHTTPTRAEVSDIANAVLDGTDAIMFSAETAAGKHPELVVQTASSICKTTEKSPITSVSQHRVECRFDRSDEAIAMAAMYIANHQDIKAIITLTESGKTPLWMSRIKSNIPIYGLSRHIRSIRALTLYRDVYPILFDHNLSQDKELYQNAIAELVKRGFVIKGDLVLFTSGDTLGEVGQTNSLKILKVDY